MSNQENLPQNPLGLAGHSRDVVRGGGILGLVGSDGDGVPKGDPLAPSGRGRRQGRAGWLDEVAQRSPSQCPGTARPHSAGKPGARR